MTNIEFPVIGAKWAVGITALVHIGVGALAIGFAFVVTVAQIVAYRLRDRRYDLIAKRVQLIHVCVYNIGTIVAIGLVFVLSGLYPQFWAQIFNHMFWTLIVEEFLFFLLATTVTFHYFFWDFLWGHKKLHIFLGALLSPLFLLQFYIINGMSAFMLTPGVLEGQVDLTKGVLGWDRIAFFNPSLLMLTVHRALANVAYAGFVVAAICGVRLMLTQREKLRDFYEAGARLMFCIAFMAFLSLPIIGYFYSYVLKYEANEAYVNLMWGRGDVVAGGIDWWWVKHICVAAMMGLGLMYFRRQSAERKSFAFPGMMVASVALFYIMFYFAMGMIMTWKFFWVMLAVGVVGAMAGKHLIAYHGGSPRALYLAAGILSALTVLLGGYVREASRPRFVDRYSHYDSVYVPSQRQPYLMVDVDPEDIPAAPEQPKKPSQAVFLLRMNCSGCHTLERVKRYPLENWELIVEHMRAYGLKLSNEQARTITEHLQSGEPY